MKRRPPHSLVWLLILTVTATGCFPTQPMYLRDRGDMSYYVEKATGIEYPDLATASLDEVTQAQPPITVIDPDFNQFYDLTLEECVSMALQNSKVIRGFGTPTLQGTRVSPGLDNLTNSPQGPGTLYNIAIRETEPGFIGTPGQISPPGSINTNTGLDSNIGVEAALADFDAQWTTNMFWTRSDEPRNTVAPFDQLTFRQDQVQFQSEIAKKTASGTQLFVRNVDVYTNNNIPLASDPLNPGFQLLPSWWRAAMEFEVRQPLLRGRGEFIQRMPIVISRIGTDQEIANLEAQLQNMVTNVEIRYWDLQAAYRNLDAAKDGRNAALETWRIVKDKYDEETDVNIQQVAQAGEQYHFFDEQVIDAYNTLLTAESSLRFLLGIASTDGQIIRPVDEAVAAPIEFDWCASLEEALLYRPELRQERWEIKKRELALAYSKNSLLPEFNVSALYRWLGLGDNLVSYDDNTPDFPNPGSGAYNDLFGGNFQEFQFTGEFRVPIGFRRELANVRNAQVKLAREIARLEDLELDVTRELSDAIRALAANLRIMQTSFNRWCNTKIEEEHFRNLADAGVETLDVALDAQRRRAQAEVAFYTALSEYNKVIALVHRRKGTILAYNGIGFDEGQWTGKAYHDAQEQARKRGASRQVNYGWTRPGVISQGPIAAPGQTASSEPTPYYTEQDGEVLSAPIQEPLMNAPGSGSYEVIDPPAQSQPQDRTLPPPRNDQSRQANPSSSQVALVGFESSEPSMMPIANPVSHQSALQNSIAKMSDRLAMPARDPLTAPGSDLAESTSRLRELQATSGMTSGNPTSQNVQWERFGFSRPDHREGNVKAVIRSDSADR